MSTDLQNVWDSGSGSKGVQRFNVEVMGDQTQMSKLSELASTNNTLRVVDVTWAEGSLADLTIGNSQTVDVVPNAAGNSTLDVTTNLNSALKDVLLFNAANPAADNANFEYTFGAGNDHLNINISKANLAASGSTNREDFSMTITMGAGDDRVETQIGDGAGTASSAWYINSKMNLNLGISTDAGNDYIHTYGAGSWIINAGAGNDVVYSDNSGAQVGVDFNMGKATWVLNTADQFTVLAAERDIDDLVSDVNDDYALYQSTLTVNLRGIEASIVIEDFNTTDLELNNLIKQAISEDVFLSKLIVAEDGPANTLVIRSLVDGDFTAADLNVSVAPPVTLPTLAADTIAQFSIANGIVPALTTTAEVFAAVQAGAVAFAVKGDYDAALANQNGLVITGADSLAANSNTIVDGTGNDVIVLSTSGMDTEIVNLTADGQADVIFNATNAVINGLELNDIVIASDGTVYTGNVGSLTINIGGGVIPPVPGTITLTPGTSGAVAATAGSDVFSFNVAAAQALAANTQLTVTGFDVVNDSLRIDTVTALGATTLDQLNGVDGIAVQVNPITLETLINFGPDADGDVIAITLAGVVDPTLVSVNVI